MIHQAQTQRSTTYPFLALGNFRFVHFFRLLQHRFGVVGVFIGQPINGRLSFRRNEIAWKAVKSDMSRVTMDKIPWKDREKGSREDGKNRAMVYSARLIDKCSDS